MDDDSRQRSLRALARRLGAPARRHAPAVLGGLEGGGLGAFDDDAAADPLIEIAQRAAAKVDSPDERDTILRATRKLVRDELLTSAEMDLFEAIVHPEGRPALDIVNGTFGLPLSPWTHLHEAGPRAHIETAIRSVGRIEVTGHPDFAYAGTGFLVGDGLLMTNRHVAAKFSTGIGDAGIRMHTDHPVVIDFGRERGAPTANPVRVTAVVLVHPHWDVAICRVEGAPTTGLRLAAIEPARLLEGEIAVIGYLAPDSRNDADVQRQIFDGKYRVKCLQPGLIFGHAEVTDDGRTVHALLHDASTLGGNSGSLLVDLTTGHVVGLHFGGVYRKRNFAVPAYELKRDPRVVATRVQFTDDPVPANPIWLQTWSAVDAAAPGAAHVAGLAGGARTEGIDDDRRGGDRTVVRIQVPIEITVSIGPITVDRDDGRGEPATD